MVKRISGSSDYIFQKLAQGKPDDLSLTSGGRKQEAREWYRQKASEVTSVNVNQFMNKAKKERVVSNITPNQIGQMFMFFYDAKLKKELPYWDKVPLIFPIEIYGDGFLGINLHYLPPMYRAKLMDALYTSISNNKYDDTTRLQISYSIMKGVKKFRFFKPCIKRYLNSHVQSKFVSISPTEWDMALMLPTERFQKKKKQTVWEDSVRKIKDSK
jgi:hypothetical protein